MTESNSYRRTPGNREVLRCLAGRGLFVAALAGWFSLSGCSEEHKVQTRRVPRETAIASRACVDDHSESDSNSEIVATARQAGYEHPQSTRPTCAPDAILTAGTTSSEPVHETTAPVALRRSEPPASALSRSVVTLAEMNSASTSAASEPSMSSRRSAASNVEASPDATPYSAAEAEALLRQAEEHNRLGLISAAKGAVFSARTEFLAALRLVAAALDAHEQTNIHIAALAAGLTAMTEAEDFASPREHSGAEIDFAPAIRSHSSRIVSESVASTMSAATLRELYTDFATGQLAAAVAGSPTGSAALHRLGKVALISASQASTKDSRGKARVFFEAALVADADNFPAANDLAVHLAEDGYYDRAIATLRDALSRAPQPALWNNLAAIHDRRGERHLAHAARLEATNFAARGNSIAGVLPSHNVAWVDAHTFAAAAKPNLEMQTAAAPKQRPVAGPMPSIALAPTPAAAAPQRAPISTALSPRRNAMVQ